MARQQNGRQKGTPKGAQKGTRRTAQRSAQNGVKPAVLTRRQGEVYDWYLKYFRQHECAPSMREAARGLGVSLHAVVGYLRILARKGVLTWRPRQARSISLLIVPDVRVSRQGQRLLLEVGTQQHYLDLAEAQQLCARMQALLGAMSGAEQARSTNAHEEEG